MTTKKARKSSRTTSGSSASFEHYMLSTYKADLEKVAQDPKRPIKIRQMALTKLAQIEKK